MGATNHTPNYNLPQFIGTDVPSWLTDINGAFSAIDTAIDAAKDAADGAASDIVSLGNRVTAAEGNIGSMSGDITTLQNTVSSLGTKVGTAALDTVSQNVSGAINELNSGKLNANDYIIIKRMYTFATRTIAAGNESVWNATIAEYSGFRPFIMMADDAGATGVSVEYMHFNSTTEVQLKVFNPTASSKTVAPKVHVYWIKEELLYNIS